MMSMMSYGLEYLFDLLESSVSAVPPLASYAPLTYLLVRWCEEQKSPYLCLSAAQQ